MVGNDKTRQYFDREARDFDVSYNNPRTLKDFIRRISYFYNKKAIEGRLEAFLSLIGKDIEGKKILDVGCGPGIYSIRLAQRGAVVTANDYAQTMLNIASSNAEANRVNIHFVPGDFFDFSPDDRFDYVFAAGVMDYIHPSRAQAFLKHMAELSNKFVLVSFPRKHAIHAVIRKLWLNLVKKIPVTFFNNHDILRLALTCGLKEVERRDVGVLWVVKFRKTPDH